MSRVWVATAAAAVCSLWSSVASASFSASPDPAPLGSSVVVDGVGGTTSSLTVTITHNGAVSETLQSLVKPTGTNCDPYTLTVMAPGLPWTTGVDGATRDVNVVFDPVVRGLRTCTVSMRDAANAEIGTFVLNGTGVAPELGVSSTNLNFGGFPVAGGNDAPINFNIQNNGDAGQPLTILSMTLGGMAPGDYSISGAPTNPIAAGGTFQVTVTFNPTTTGTRDATLTIVSDDPVDADEVVNLTGVGQAPVIGHTSPDPMSFTQLAGQQSAVQNIVLRNNGDSTLTVTSASINASGMGWIEFTGTPESACDNVTTNCDFVPDLTIAAAATLNVGIRCQPPSMATGSVSAVVSFASDTVGGDNQVTVNCTAQKPDITVAPPSIAFPSTPVVGPNPTDTITVTNIGDALLTYNITLTGANPGDFTYNNPQCTVGTPCTLAGGIDANRVFTVTFNPSADGPRSATMHFNSDDQETPDVTVLLSGTGTGAEITRVSTDPLTFGQVLVGSTATRTLTFRNDGTGDNLNITAVSLSLPAIYTLAPGTTFPVVIPPGMTGGVDIVCTPTARQTYNGTATAMNNSYNAPSLATGLTCQGIDGDLRVNSVDPAFFDFGNVPQGTPVNQTFTLKNFGELAVNSITASIAPLGVGYTVTGVPTTLAADDGSPGGPDQATITVTFSPTLTADGGAADVTFDGDTDDALLQVTGNGLSNGIDIMPGSITYADTRWDQFTDRTFLATNSGEATLTVSQAMLSSGTDFSITQIRIDREGNGSFEAMQPGVPPNFVLCGAGDTAVTCPGMTGGVAEFTVRFAPEDTLLGNKSDMITLICSLPSPDNMRIIPLSGVSVSANLGVVPGMTVDFGGVDLDGPLPATQVLSLQNTSASTTLDVTGHDPFVAPFGATGFAPGPLDPGETNDTTITYTPTVEQAAPGDMQVVTYNLAGLHPTVGPNAVMITVLGHGTDRHFVSNGPIVFPPTYRNPNPAPEADVTVMNTGAAPLDVSAVMVTGDPVFTLVSGAPQIIGPASMATFRVRFAPIAMEMYDGVVGIMHDDDGIATPPTSEVALSGLGLVPEIMIPQDLEIGPAIVGEEVHSDDIIQLLNMSDATTHPTTFTVRALTVTDASGVITVDDPEMRPIAPGELQRFGATFTPTVAGPFTTTVDVFVDNDPQPIGSVTLTGYAVEVDVRGGGCSTGGGAGGGATVVIVLGLALGLRRRRRPARAGAGAGAVVTTVAVALVVAPAAPRADITVQSFHPMPSIEDDLFAVESATVGEANAWTAGIALSYARDPLVSTITNCGSECPDMVTVGQTASLVKQQTMVAVGGAYALANRFEVGLTVPILMQSGDSAMIGATADGTTLGDIAAHGKAQLVKVGRFALGAAAVITAPTAKADQYAGYDGPSGSISLLASHRTRRFLASVNVGFLGRKTEDLATVNQGSAVLFGAGAGFRVAHSLWVAAEMFGDYGIVEESVPSLQALGGLRVRLGGSITVGLGGGVGIGEGLGVPKARGFLLVGYSPKMRPAEAMRPPPPPPDTRDSDGDGLVNADDICPNEAEDKDVFEDNDGCPDPDNDGDKVNDGGDKCADEAEDPDGFQDDDGCPDRDNDGDGIEDPTDVCPNALEDMDSHADLDGCPDPDNDHDGILDGKDKCVDVAETINGNNDDDGCPDKGDSLVLLAADRIEILEPIKFSGTTTKMTKKTINLLGQVAATIRANPEIVRLRVTAHVHPRSTKEKDQQLSDDRANAIKDWLVNWGVSTDRIDARGFGSSKPLVSANKAHAEDINDRIEFVIMEKSQ